MTGRLRALLRLYAVQGSWNYERMLGVGMGYAAEPLLADLATADPRRHAEASVRAAEFFNCNPNLAGLALGATVRAEYLGVPGEQVSRLRTALCSPLGALGDQLFWAGVVPGLVGLALVGVALGLRAWPVLAFVVLYNVVRLGVAVWALRTGLHAGPEVPRAIAASWLPRWAGAIGPYAGFAVGVAVPLAAGWSLRHFPVRGVVGALVLAAVGVALARWWGRGFTAVRFALAAMAAAVALRWVIR
jgi:PTS system mannose-specific IID component